jgi:hypothetical protein
MFDKFDIVSSSDQVFEWEIDWGGEWVIEEVERAIKGQVANWKRSQGYEQNK